MPESIRTLSSKLAAPHAADTIRRERLLGLFGPAAAKRLTAVVAGAGYGKTTLVAQAAAAWKMPFVWYRLDASDRDLATFLSYLVAGFQQHHPGFGQASLRQLREAANPSHVLPALLRTFLAELDSVLRDETAVILDDYHCVAGSPEIDGALQMLLQDASPLLHLVLISRAQPAIPLSRLRAMRQVIDIEEEDLAFTPLETEQLLVQFFDFAVDRIQAEAICGRIGGWVSGLILLCHALRGKGRDAIALEQLQGPRFAISRYLEENVYGALAAELQQFLVQSAVLSRMSAPLCDRLLGIGNSEAILRFLEENHLFTSSSDGWWYSYHQLFRDFLQSRLNREQGAASIHALHARAAALLEESGDDEAALEHCLAAGATDRACGLLERLGRRLIAEGRLELLSDYLGLIPQGALEAHPWLHYLHGLLHGLRGDHPHAIEHYDRALRLFGSRADGEGLQACLVESGLSHLDTGDVIGAQALFRRVLDLPGLDPTLRIELLGYVIYTASYLMDLELADRCFDEAIALQRTIADHELRDQCLVWIYFYQGFRYAFSGECVRVLQLVESARGLAPGAEADAIPVGLYLPLSMACFGLRHYAKGYATAQEALALVEEGQRPGRPSAQDWYSPRTAPLALRQRGLPDTFAAWVLSMSSRNALALGKAEVAASEARESLNRFRTMGCRFGEALASAVLGLAQLALGRPEAAEQCSRAGLAAVCTVHVLRSQGMLRLNLAEALLALGRLEEAAEQLEENGGAASDPTFGARRALLRCRLYRSTGRSSEAAGALEEALELCEQLGLDDLLLWHRNWIIPALLEAPTRPYARTLLERMGPDGTALEPGQVETLEAPASLEVFMLGAFRVRCNGREIPAQRWKSRKARMLFQYLVYAHSRGYVNKEVLMELLWPEQDPALTVKRFHVALAALRKTLEPGIARGIPSAFLERYGDGYRVNLGDRGSSDVESFTKAVREARDVDGAIGCLERAEAAYGGDFLIEEPYSEWCAAVREKLRRDYLQVTRQLVAHACRRGDHLRCIELAEKHLEVDPYAEDVMRALMAACWETGDKSRMARSYQVCKGRIATDLGCSLSTETERLYRTLLSR